MDYPSMDRLAELQQMIADFGKVKRAIPFADTNNAESDVEHSFGLAITCWYLHPFIAPDLSIGKILEYALAHDIVEIHAGDTYVFDKDKITTKEQRERDALKELRKEWPDFKQFVHRAEEYMDKANEETKFVKAVDKLLPIIMIELDTPKTWWNNHEVTLEIEKVNKRSIEVSDYMKPYYGKLIAWLDERNNIPKS